MSSKVTVLVIDDEAAILRFLKPALEANNYEMSSADTVAEAIRRIAADTPEIVLLDLGLPDGDGKDVIRRVREWSDVPIIVLSAREREAEKIESLDLGADDYVNKPFNVGELMARMRTALRHRIQRKAEIPVLRVSDLEIDSARHRVTRGGTEIRLTPKEFELVSFLARHAGRVVTHKQILAAVWDRPIPRTRNICASTSASFGKKSKSCPTIPKLFSRSPASVIALRRLTHLFESESNQGFGASPGGIWCVIPKFRFLHQARQIGERNSAIHG